ncbi:MAG: D-alanyl-D-alanine carboxypeptidase/D-alanyl-D-alanine-endopeptidase [Zoogloeaceae bacterium]|nr:D-alanyl-D-alanine carboxypeptidase/D-alanyl-D-alanine-endopeptidase [Zoogloeaceae bacterium]
MPVPLANALESAKLPAAHAAFFVQQVDANAPLLSYNAEQAMNPASTMKLVTAYAALDLLGPAYRWKTQVLADALPRAGRLAGRLAGNLYLKGSGDPSLTVEQLWMLLRQLRSRGITEIGGDLMLDRSDFQLPPHDPAAFDNEPLRPYNAGADALLVNFNSLRIALLPNIASRSVNAVIETPVMDFRIDPRIQLSDGPCGDWREKLTVAISGKQLVLGGSLAASCGEKTLHLSALPADDHIAQLFSALWQELGGTFSGKVSNGTVPAGAHLLLEHSSPSLSEIVFDMNKWSNNVMARQLLLALAPSRPASIEAGRRRLESWLNDKGVRGITIDNGAGLSREARLSAAGLGKLLLAAWKSPVMPELMASLPIAGSDGTLKKRLGDSPAAGRAHLKTGYIEGVRSIAGYVMDRSGQRWVVVGILNDAQMKNGSKPLDELVRWVAER